LIYAVIIVFTSNVWCAENNLGTRRSEVGFGGKKARKSAVRRWKMETSEEPGYLLTTDGVVG
jgi:hypothetical protein